MINKPPEKQEHSPQLKKAPQDKRIDLVRKGQNSKIKHLLSGALIAAGLAGGALKAYSYESKPVITKVPDSEVKHREKVEKIKPTFKVKLWVGERRSFYPQAEPQMSSANEGPWEGGDFDGAQYLIHQDQIIFTDFTNGNFALLPEKNCKLYVAIQSEIEKHSRITTGHDSPEFLREVQSLFKKFKKGDNDGNATPFFLELGDVPAETPLMDNNPTSPKQTAIYVIAQ